MPLVRSLNDYFLAPHSRYTEVRKSDILKHPELMILAESEEAGVFLVQYAVYELAELLCVSDNALCVG